MNREVREILLHGVKCGKENKGKKTPEYGYEHAAPHFPSCCMMFNKAGKTQVNKKDQRVIQG